jgi:hypothetical protein
MTINLPKRLLFAEAFAEPVEGPAEVVEERFSLQNWGVAGSRERSRENCETKRGSTR